LPGSEQGAHAQLPEDRAQPPVLALLAAVDEVAGREHEVGRGSSPLSFADRALEHRRAVDRAVDEFALAP
jgi:hypothetical protein